MVNIKPAITDREILSCYDVMVQLHEKLVREEYVSLIKRLNDKGYNLYHLKDGEAVKSVIGFHLNECIAWESYLYVVDLVTDINCRSRGYGEALLNWVISYAKEQGCNQVHLDSRVIRHATHKFYLNQGFILGGYHFHKKLEQ